MKLTRKLLLEELGAKDWSFTIMKIDYTTYVIQKDLVKKRYSCRKMSDRKVEDNLIERIIDSANSAPTAVNKQPVKIFWMKSNEAKDGKKDCAIYIWSRTFGSEI